jgi:putative ABC transport system substrate-binding protein
MREIAKHLRCLSLPLLSRLPTLAALFGLTLPAPAPRAAPQGTSVLVVVSQDGQAYRDALASFRHSLEHQRGQLDVRVVQLDGDAVRAPQVIPATAQADLVLTLGTLATRESLRRYQTTPLVAGMILSADELEGSPNATGVFLQFPVQTELEWLARLLPSLRRVGVIYHSADTKARVARAERLAAESNLTIQSYHIDGPQELPDALENLADRADVLWGVTDPIVFNPETAKSLLVFSFRHQIPLIGHSTPWVKAGALYALDRDYGDIGVQCAEMAEKILAGRAPSTLPPVPPRKIRYTLNRKTAEQMKLELPERVYRDAAEVVE